MKQKSHTKRVSEVAAVVKRSTPTEKDAITTNEYRKEPLHSPRNWEPLTYIDATPNKGYVLRILRSHLQNCKARWGGTHNELVEAMNRMQEQREQLLKDAIAKLEACCA